MEAKVASPKLGTIVHLTEGIKNSPARGPGTQNRIVHNWRQVGALLDQLIEGPQGYDHPGSLDLRGGKDVPGKPYSIPVFILLNKVFVGGHLAEKNKFHYQSSKNGSKVNLFDTNTRFIYLPIMINNYANRLVRLNV